MNMKSVATSLGVSRQTVSAWVKKGCPHKTQGRQCFFDLVEVKEWRGESTKLPSSPSVAEKWWDATGKSDKEIGIHLVRELQELDCKGENEKPKGSEVQEGR